MRILVINPNTSTSMTKQVAAALGDVKRKETILEVVNPSRGPSGLASAYDEMTAGYEVLNIIREKDCNKYDAIIIACFSDPGVTAAKELCEIPVLGIAEASMHVACLLGRKFTVLTTTRERIPSKRLYVQLNGLGDRLASVRALELSVEATSHEPDETKKAILQTSECAISEDGAEVIILGCAGMAGYAQEVEQKLGVPVLDPSAVALKLAEAMIDLELSVSKKAFYAYPPGLLHEGT